MNIKQKPLFIVILSMLTLSGCSTIQSWEEEVRAKSPTNFVNTDPYTESNAKRPSTIITNPEPNRLVEEYRLKELTKNEKFDSDHLQKIE